MPDKVSCTHCNRSYDVDFSKISSLRCYCGNPVLFPGWKKSTKHNQQQQPKLIDCPDCGTSISRLAAACPKCGRAGQAALEQGKYTKGIYFVICMVVSWLFVQYISSIREEGRKDRSIKANLELQRTINDPRATEGDYRRTYEKVLNP